MPDYYQPTKLHRDRILQDLGQEFERWGVAWSDWDYETNYRGSRRAALSVEERRVTITWTTTEGLPASMTLDTQPTINSNLRAMGLSIRDLRLIELRGCLQSVRDSLLMLAGPSGPVERPPLEVLGLHNGATAEAINAMGKVKRAEFHPDNGGDPDAFKEVNRALERLAEEVSGVRP